MGVRWYGTEVKLLRRLYQQEKLPLEEIAERLPRHNAKCIAACVYRFRMHRPNAFREKQHVRWWRRCHEYFQQRELRFGY